MAVKNDISADKVLLVEAESDRSLFEQIFRTLELNPEIKVACPRDLNPKNRNGKQAVLRQTGILVKSLFDLDAGLLKRLAVVLDADSEDAGGLGFHRTVDQFKEIVGKHDFTVVNEADNTNGLVFRHPEGLADIGLWVMPDNKNNGMLEDWLNACIHADEQVLFKHAETVVEALEPKKFKSIHQTKAEVASWLAWQEKPGHGLYHAQKANLLDASKPLYSQLSTWLLRVYT